MMEWQPIETAPKDGMRVMLCSAIGKIPGWANKRDYYHLAQWNGQHWTPYVPNHWTHWMPLPPPPTESQVQP